MKPTYVLAAALLALAPAFISGSSSSAAAMHLPARQVSDAFAKGMPLVEVEAYKIHASRRDAPGVAEVHTKDTDIIYMLEGAAEIVTGGSMVEGRPIAADEIRGPSIAGGEVTHLVKGDVFVVPNGVPHWFREIQGPVLYYVVKVTDRAGAGR